MSRYPDRPPRFTLFDGIGFIAVLMLAVALVLFILG